MKYFMTILRGLITLLAWAIGGVLLHKYEFFVAFRDIDNVVGMIPVALILIAALGITALLWTKHSKQSAPISATIAVLTALAIALFPTALRGDWWLNPTTSGEAEAKPDLTLYAPFSPNSKTAKLDAESALMLSDSLPILDGATALYPLYAAFAETVYDIDAFSDDYVLCTNTRNAYNTIISGERDTIFVTDPSEQQLDAAKDAGVELCFTPIGREAFVFLVGNDNPVNDISYQQIRNVYSGKTANWYTLGWREGGRIIAFQRPEGSGSQTSLQFYMGDLPIQAPQPLPDPSLIGTNSLMRQVSVKRNGVQPALGYSYRYYATAMYANPDAKLLSINGVEPSVANIQNGSYPFVSDFYAVTVGEPTGNSKLLIDWILSPQGQTIIQQTGYTPL